MILNVLQVIAWEFTELKIYIDVSYLEGHFVNCFDAKHAIKNHPTSKRQRIKLRKKKLVFWSNFRNDFILG